MIRGLEIHNLGLEILLLTLKFVVVLHELEFLVIKLQLLILEIVSFIDQRRDLVLETKWSIIAVFWGLC